MIQHRSKISAVDLFCGAGGLTCGLERSGVDVRLGVDLDPVCEYPYAANNSADFLLKSVTDLSSSELTSAFGDSGYRLLAGCAPCQTFSRYNSKADSSDERWWLIAEFSRLVADVLPEFVTMENVPGLKDQAVFDDFVSSLKACGYFVSYQVVNCADYGVAQHRNRLVLIASLLGEIKILTPSAFGRPRRTVRDAIGDLPSQAAGAVDACDSLHRSAALSELNLKRIRASKQGGTWRDWPPELLLKCHAKDSGKTYPSVYGRIRWDEPSPTLTTQFYGYGNGRFGHPEQDRALSLREGAILQGFPTTYQFAPESSPLSRSQIGRMIGNAVPVVLGELVGSSIYAFLGEEV